MQINKFLFIIHKFVKIVYGKKKNQLMKMQFSLAKTYKLT